MGKVASAQEKFAWQPARAQDQKRRPSLQFCLRTRLSFSEGLPHEWPRMKDRSSASRSRFRDGCGAPLQQAAQWKWTRFAVMSPFVMATGPPQSPQAVLS